MKIRLTDRLVQKLIELGQTIDIGRPTFVFVGGEVRIVEDSKYKEKEDESQGARGPAAGSRQGAAGSRRTPGEAGNSVGSIWPEWLASDNLALLLDSYPGSRATFDINGAWLKVPISPLGPHGPTALLVIALPKSGAIHPRSWAFWLETPGVRSVGPRHTNYPYGDACAFPQFQGHWHRKDGIRPYVDIHAEWLIRQLHYSIFARWVGRQMAPFAMYALNQFNSVEQCHCQSSQRYGECCQAKDFGEYQADPARQLRLAMQFTQGRWFNSQRPPNEIVAFALGGEAPDMAEIFRRFKECIRPAQRASLFKSRLLGSTAWAGLSTQPVSWRVAA